MSQSYKFVTLDTSHKRLNLYTQSKMNALHMHLQVAQEWVQEGL
jgi:hypothetical protein